MRIILAILFLLSIPAVGQDLAADLDRFQEALTSSPYRSDVSVEIRKEGRTLDRMESQIARNGDAYYSNSNGMILLNTGDELIMVSEHTKTIEIYSAPETQQAPDLKTVNDFRQMTDEVEYLGESEGLKGYKLNNADPQYAFIELWFSKDTGMLAKVLFRNANPGMGDADEQWDMMLVTYKTEFSRSAARELIDIDRFLEKKGRKYVAAADYAEYTVKNLKQRS